MKMRPHAALTLALSRRERGIVEMVDAIFRVDTHAACGTSGRMKTASCRMFFLRLATRSYLLGTSSPMSRRT
ncbi:MAG: hypothetical protein M1551_06140, partial [Firmicutes bacterium]|nr:hypothetical protein [Bacillota bacterium]